MAGLPCRQFDPPCGLDSAEQGWSATPGSADPTGADVMGECANNWIDGVVADKVLIPAGLAPGDWVLQWRWDAEETSQVRPLGQAPPNPPPLGFPSQSAFRDQLDMINVLWYDN